MIDIVYLYLALSVSSNNVSGASEWQPRSNLCLRPENLFSRSYNTHATIMLSETLANNARNFYEPRA